MAKHAKFIDVSPISRVSTIRLVVQDFAGPVVSLARLSSANLPLWTANLGPDSAIQHPQEFSAVDDMHWLSWIMLNQQGWFKSQRFNLLWLSWMAGHTWIFFNSTPYELWGKPPIKWGFVMLFVILRLNLIKGRLGLVWVYSSLFIQDRKWSPSSYRSKSEKHVDGIPWYAISRWWHISPWYVAHASVIKCGNGKSSE